MNSSSANPEESGNNLPTFMVSAGRFGLKGALYFTGVLFLFSVINIIFFLLAIFKLRHIESNSAYITLIAVVLIVGIAMTGVVLYFTYKYLLTNGISLVYKQCRPFFRKVCCKFVDKSEDYITNKTRNNRYMQSAIGAMNPINEFYGNKLPSGVKKSLNFLLKQVPFADLFLKVKTTVSNNDNETVSNALFSEVDFYITNSLLGNNSMRLILWIFIANILLQSILIYFFAS